METKNDNPLQPFQLNKSNDVRIATEPVLNLTCAYILSSNPIFVFPSDPLLQKIQIHSLDPTFNCVLFCNEKQQILGINSCGKWSLTNCPLYTQDRNLMIKITTEWVKNKTGNKFDYLDKTDAIGNAIKRNGVFYNSNFNMLQISAKEHAIFFIVGVANYNNWF